MRPSLAATVIDVFVYVVVLNLRATTRAGKVVAAIMLWVVLVGSKFAVLEAVNAVFGNRVSLGGFIPVTLLILALLVSRLAVRRLLHG
jgi:hypothetical protein